MSSPLDDTLQIDVITSVSSAMLAQDRDTLIRWSVGVCRRWDRWESILMISRVSWLQWKVMSLLARSWTNIICWVRMGAIHRNSDRMSAVEEEGVGQIIRWRGHWYHWARSMDLNQNGRNIKRNAFFLCHAFSRQCYCVLLHFLSVCLDFVVLFASVYLHDLKCLESLKKKSASILHDAEEFIIVITRRRDCTRALSLCLPVQVTIRSTLITSVHRPRCRHNSTS